MNAAPLGAERLLSPQDAAALLSVEVSTLTRWGDRGELTWVRTLGGHRCYLEDDVRGLLLALPDHGAE